MFCFMLGFLFGFVLGFVVGGGGGGWCFKTKFLCVALSVLGLIL